MVGLLNSMAIVNVAQGLAVEGGGDMDLRREIALHVLEAADLPVLAIAGMPRGDRDRAWNHHRPGTAPVQLSVVDVRQVFDEFLDLLVMLP